MLNSKMVRKMPKAAAKPSTKAEQPSKSVLKKYKPPPLTPNAEISWEGEFLRLQLSEGHGVNIPMTLRGMEILAMNLRGRKLAAAAGAQPKLGSDVMPTQAQIEAWLLLKSAANFRFTPAPSLDGIELDYNTDLGV
jgi:hypothetical protein